MLRVAVHLVRWLIFVVPRHGAPGSVVGLTTLVVLLRHGIRPLLPSAAVCFVRLDGMMVNEAISDIVVSKLWSGTFCVSELRSTHSLLLVVASQACRHGRQRDKVMSVLEMMVQDGIPPSGKSYSSALQVRFFALHLFLLWL